METARLLKALEVPKGKVDVVLDTDTYNEIDDQFALAYLLRSDERLNTLAICAAPFFNSRSKSPADGMEKSYDEILKVLELCGKTELRPNVFKGSARYLPNETTPVDSPAADEIIRLAHTHNPEAPLYVVAIGAITNVASAILKDKSIIENIVVVWLGGHALHWNHTGEFNMVQDIAAARVVFGCGVPLVQLPCNGVVSNFAISAPELEHWLIGVNPLCDYLAKNTIEYMEERKKTPIWSKVVWDVTAVAWLLNDGARLMSERIIHAPIPEYDKHYALSEDTHFIKYVWDINRDVLFSDLFEKLKK
ncbi:MAG: nucleoside hydrolase [Clostridia bacterium]|nr:nucleoside hydrolase [Clostridia bacterium]